jgi:hypothetical protein
MALEHPRALLMARVQPNCVLFCTSSIVVTNSEGVKSRSTGDVSMDDDVTSSVTASPTVEIKK